MRVYWDSTALLNAQAAQSVLARLDEGQHLTRSHAYVEAFHHLSGRGLPLKDGRRLAVTPGDAARMIRKLAKRVQAHDLAPEQTLSALDDAQSQGRIPCPVSARALAAETLNLKRTLSDLVNLAYALPVSPRERNCGAGHAWASRVR